MSNEDNGAIQRRIKTYVKRAGRCTQGERRAYEQLKERWVLPLDGRPLRFDEMFANKRDTIVEIGFGMGHATAQIAQANPAINYIAIDLHIPGIGRLLSEIARLDLENLFIIEGDALSALEDSVAPSSVAGFHVFFPDPWPKRRHHKRRLMRRPNTDLMASRLSEGGYIYFATDWADYAEYALAELSATAHLVNTCSGFCPHKSWRPTTSFERKAIAAGRQIYELHFVKQSPYVLSH